MRTVQLPLRARGLPRRQLVPGPDSQAIVRAVLRAPAQPLPGGCATGFPRGGGREGEVLHTRPGTHSCCAVSGVRAEYQTAVPLRCLMLYLSPLQRHSLVVVRCCSWNMRSTPQHAQEINYDKDHELTTGVVSLHNAFQRYP